MKVTGSPPPSRVSSTVSPASSAAVQCTVASEPRAAAGVRALLVLALVVALALALRRCVVLDRTSTVAQEVEPPVRLVAGTALAVAAAVAAAASAAVDSSAAMATGLPPSAAAPTPRAQDPQADSMAPRASHCVGVGV